jgi:hypothetical protein
MRCAVIGAGLAFLLVAQPLAAARADETPPNGGGAPIALPPSADSFPRSGSGAAGKPGLNLELPQGKIASRQAPLAPPPRRRSAAPREKLGPRNGDGFYPRGNPFGLTGHP